MQKLVKVHTAKWLEFEIQYLIRLKKLNLPFAKYNFMRHFNGHMHPGKITFSPLQAMPKPQKSQNYVIVVQPGNAMVASHQETEFLQRFSPAANALYELADSLFRKREGKAALKT